MEDPVVDVADGVEAEHEEDGAVDVDAQVSFLK
jgi:hypothetical protein